MTAKTPKKKGTKKPPCVYHPPNRRLGDICMECGHPVAKK